jgi:transcriptional regulator with PAS, ATPase and Fis domain
VAELLSGGNTVGNIAKYTFDHLIGESEPILEAARRARRAALTDSNVLIRGESGVGKEIFAQAIHNASARSRKSFVAVNCAAFSKELIASELFGYESGAFTGARREGASGKFEAANHGTLFLDEIGDMPLETQAVLLRVLDEGAFRKVGGNNLIEVDVRIIAATNKNLKELIDKNRFLEDLFYRLSVIRLTIPPLRARGSDVFLFAQSYMKRYCARIGRAELSFSRDALDVLGGYDWPGTIRVLENLLEGLIGILEGSVRTGDDIRAYLSDGLFEPPEPPEKSCPPEDDERGRLLLALRESGNNKTRAAASLGCSRSTLYRRITELEIEIK